jgi:hypothetical protein
MYKCTNFENPTTSQPHIVTMLLCYNVTNQGRRLSASVLSTWRWLWRWQGQASRSGKSLYPSTRYLAQKQGVTERTIYRRLAALKKVGALAVEVVEGVVRFLKVLGPPPKETPAAAKSSGVMGRRLAEVEARTRQGSIPYSETQKAGSTQVEQQQPEQADAVATVLEQEAGLAKEDAVAIAAEVQREKWSLERVKRAVAAFREARGIRTPGGWLRAAIRAGRGPQEAIHSSDKPERPVRDRSQAGRVPTQEEIERYRALAVELLTRRGEAVTEESRREVARSLWRRDVVLGYV